MANKKSKDATQPTPDELLKQRVDEMMDIKGGKDGSPTVDDNAGISEVAASINQSLTHDLNVEEPSLTPEPEEPGTNAEASSAGPSPESQTAPELPDKLESPEAPSETNTPEPAAAPAIPPESEEALAEVVDDGASETVADSEVKPLPDSDVDDSYTQKAVDDIAAEESDKLLAVEDKKTAAASKAVVSKTSFTERIRRLFRHRRFWLAVIILLVVIEAIPATRYMILGLFIKKSVTITVVDSKTSSPVSSATVSLAGDTAKTDANGKAQVAAGLGQRELKVTKRYYQDYTSSYMVGFKAATTNVKFVATGRLVPVTVVNKISGKPISGIQIQAEGTTAKTNSKGQAEIALPAKAASYKGKIGGKGYNATEVTITATDKIVKANTFEITPAGQIYFLSNRSGTLDVVKSDLDGGNRKTVLVGTGKEDTRTTSLLASRDWRYLALKSHREGNQAALYLIDTTTDKSNQFDSGDSDFNLIGWSNHNFVYSVTRNTVTYSQTGKQALKSYDAERSQLNQLDQTTAEGTAGNSAYQSFANFYVLDDLVVYTTQWNKESNSGTIDISAKNDTIRGVQSNGQNKKDYQSFPSTNNNYIQASPYEPQAVYFAVYDNNSKPTFYEFENQAVKKSTIDQATFDKTYPTFLVSPSGGATLWTELVDGKNTLFTGDTNAGNKQPLASNGDYSPYGWYSDSYVLVSKNSSELYVMPATGLPKDRPALKVTDYYKPAQTYAGYGYGYGGL